MRKNSLSLLGVPFDNLSMEEVAEKILLWTNTYIKDGVSRYVCTVNVDFMVKALSVYWNEVYNPELLDIYRESNLVTCDGKPLLWLSFLLGSSLKERVTGTDLLPMLAGVLAQNNKSIFLLGGSENINRVAGLVLESLYPCLSIAGQATPFIVTEGENLIRVAEQDAFLVEEINRAAPDVLLIALGNPKQEIWFNRIKAQLRVPVSIGVGGVFDILSGAHSRAPSWMQTWGLEWLHRLIQEPKRLWKRYFLDIWVFFGMAVPLVVYHTMSRILYRFRIKKNEPAEYPLLFLSTTQTIAVIPLPALIDQEYCKLVHHHLDESFNQDGIVLDFDNVSHITIEGFAFLIRIWQQAERTGKELYVMNISFRLRMLMKLHRIWDIVKDSVMNNPQQVLRTLIQRGSHSEYFESVHQDRDYLRIYFFGKIGADQNREAYIAQLTPLLRGRDCVLDFRYCTYIDNAGFSFLLKIREIVKSNKSSLHVSKCNSMIERLFRLNKIDAFFTPTE